MKIVNRFLFTIVFVFIFTPFTPVAVAVDYSIPIRWCVIGNDANSNGSADPGELGAPAFTDPSLVGEADTDHVLWRRHERPSDRTYIPQAGVTFRSALWNIAEDATLSFPIIPDPDTSDPDHEYGDLLAFPRDERDLARDACIQAWLDDHGVEDIGVMGIVARRLVDADGTAGTNGVGRTGNRLLWVQDNAFVFPDPTPVGDLRDPFDGTTGHEIGHALPASLLHTVSDVNIMRSSPADVGSDGVRDNFDLSSSITDSDGDVVDQIDLISDTAPTIPGCKIAGTNTDCSTRSSARVDVGRDADVPFLDLRLITLADRGGVTTAAIHEIAGPFTEELANFDSVEFFTLFDLDDDITTGGVASELGVPTSFSGTDLVARVTVDLPVVEFLKDGGLAIKAHPSLWRFDNKSKRFIELDQPRGLFARINPLIDIIDPVFGKGKPISELVGHSVEVAFPNSLRGIMNHQPRLQIVVRGVKGGVEVIDKLDDETPELGTRFKHVFPQFPICKATPDPVPAGGNMRVRASGLLPNSAVTVILGDTVIGSQQSSVAGKIDGNFTVPTSAATGKRLLTVGVNKTAFTADCIVTVFPKDPKGSSGGSGNSDPDNGVCEKCFGTIHNYLAIVILGILVIIALLIWLLMRHRSH